MEKYTVLEYQYRDAGNYKASGELLIKGELTKNVLDMLAPYLYDNEYFIPDEVGIPPLQSILWDESGEPNEDDHEWHSFQSVRKACPEDLLLPVWGTKEELILRFQNKK